MKYKNIAIHPVVYQSFDMKSSYEYKLIYHVCSISEVVYPCWACVYSDYSAYATDLLKVLLINKTMKKHISTMQKATILIKRLIM